MKRVLRHRRLPLTVAAVFVVLGGNVVIHDGAAVLFVLILSALGCAAACLIPAGACGYSAARHSLRTRQAITESERRRELTR